MRIRLITVEEFDSIKDAALHYGRAPRIFSRKLKGGEDIPTLYGHIIKIEAIDGKTDDVTGIVREHTDQPEENIPLGAVEVRGGGGWFQQALGKAATAVHGQLRKFYQPRNVD